LPEQTDSIPDQDPFQKKMKEPKLDPEVGIGLSGENCPMPLVEGRTDRETRRHSQQWPRQTDAFGPEL
jgi:hypothetical protein